VLHPVRRIVWQWFTAWKPSNDALKYRHKKKPLLAAFFISGCLLKQWRVS
jgi:hypothetical protein